jgi:hypothetical protein
MDCGDLHALVHARLIALIETGRCPLHHDFNEDSTGLKRLSLCMPRCMQNVVNKAMSLAARFQPGCNRVKMHSKRLSAPNGHVSFEVNSPIDANKHVIWTLL